MGTELAKVVSPVVDQMAVSPEALKRQVQAIQLCMREVMHENVHYGKIPGCGIKPALFKPGAEKICLLFRLVPKFRFDERQLPNDHMEIVVTSILEDLTGRVVGEGIGSCSTREAKYRWRNSERLCPNCQQATIIKSKDFKTKNVNGWLCYEKKGGCGEKFPLGDNDIEGQKVGKTENPDIADQYNTVRKMAKKRALVDVVISATAASDIFTQQITDEPERPEVVVTPIVASEVKGSGVRYFDLSSLDPENRGAVEAWFGEQKEVYFDQENGYWVANRKFSEQDEAFILKSKLEVIPAEPEPEPARPIPQPETETKVAAPESALRQRINAKKQSEVTQ